MASCIVKLGEDEYMEWSSIADAPLTYLMTRAEAVTEFGAERIIRADDHGTSYTNGVAAEEVIKFNRAGVGETCLSLDELRAQYTNPNKTGIRS